MKIYYNNDENIPVMVQVNGLQLDPTKWNHVSYYQLDSKETRLFEFDAPEGAIPYIKKWNHQGYNKVLLTYILPEHLPVQQKESE